ncbi:hypothetical protein VE03_09846 [Pseudogymnoascus sp. 23342-1-I1]|nr:hypothetical protein VE03_09846 [Pseudogymnoascus sp. 23342-1-I1]
MGRKVDGRGKSPGGRRQGMMGIQISQSLASIVEMVKGLDQEEFMEFARIIMVSLPAASVTDMRKRGMMEDIQRVTGLGIVNNFREGYDNDGYDQSDAEDEFGYTAELDDVEDPSTINRYSYKKASPTPEISSDEPMDDYQSSDNNNDIHSRRLMSKSSNCPRPSSRRKSSATTRSPLESSQKSDKNEEEQLPGASRLSTTPSVSAVPRTSLSRPNFRSSNNTPTDQAEIDRFRECFTAAHTTLAGRRCSVKDEVLDRHMDKSSHLAKLFKYEDMLKSVFHILESGSCGIPPAHIHELQLEEDISSDIYRVVKQSNYKVENTAQSRLREAHIFLNFNQVFEAEILRRNLDPSMAHINRENPVIASIKLDMACVSTGPSRRDLVDMQTENNQLYRNFMGPI